MATDVKNESDIDRKTDYMFRVLADEPNAETEQVYKAVRKVVQSKTVHPCVQTVLQSADTSALMKKALIILALGIDSSIKQHFIDHRETCGDTVSEFLFGVLPQLLEDFFKGKTCVEYFVCSAIVEYVTI